MYPEEMFINNHVDIIISFHESSEFVGSRIVGIEVKPRSIRHDSVTLNDDSCGADAEPQPFKLSAGTERKKKKRKRKERVKLNNLLFLMFSFSLVPVAHFFLFAFLVCCMLKIRRSWIWCTRTRCSSRRAASSGPRVGTRSYLCAFLPLFADGAGDSQLSLSLPPPIFFLFLLFSCCLLRRYLQSAESTSIHWFSIVNSLIIVIFLSGMVALILVRTLHKDIARYNQTDNSEEAQVCLKYFWHSHVF
jgi:hypothetical protein